MTRSSCPKIFSPTELHLEHDSRDGDGGAGIGDNFMHIGLVRRSEFAVSYHHMHHLRSVIYDALYILAEIHICSIWQQLSCIYTGVVTL